MLARVVNNQKIWERLPKSFTEGLIKSISSPKAIHWSKEGEQLKAKKKYDIPQAWWNASLKRAIFWSDNDEFASKYKVMNEVGVYPEDSKYSLREGKKQQLDHRINGNTVDSFIEIEFGNVGSLYRDIHKLLLCHVHHDDPVLILIVPTSEVANRCDGTTEGSEMVELINREVNQYYPGVRLIIIEVSACEKGWFNLGDYAEKEVVGGNWIWDPKYVDNVVEKTRNQAGTPKQQVIFDNLWSEITS